jgi:thioredoxin reductase (NADPH)
VKTGKSSDIACFGVFPFIGVAPDTGFLPEAVKRGRSGHIRVDNNHRSSVTGLYAVGAVRKDFSGSLVSAAGEGATVAELIARSNRK